MGRSKARNKKYNPRKAGEQMIKHLLRNVAVVFVPAMTKGCQLAHLNSGNIFIPTMRQALSIEKSRFKWNVHCLVFMRDHNGVDYSSLQAYPITEPMFQWELVDFLNAKHAELIDTCNKKHLINVGWLSTISGVDATNQQLDNIFQTLGAWDGLAQWEVDKLHETLSSDTESD